MEKLNKLTEEYFASGTDPDTYLAELKTYRSIVRSLAETAEASPAHVEELKTIVSRTPGPVVATVHTEPWCGDWACNFPILRSFFAAAEVPFRIFNQADHGELKEYYLAGGDDHIPIVSLWDGNGREIARWIEAPVKVQELKVNWKKEHPRLMELYGIKSEDKNAEKEFAKLYRSFVQEMSEWYREGLWSETTGEIIGLLKKKS